MSQSTVDLESLRRLPVAERLQLVEDLWDSIATDTPAVDIPMSPQLVAELERRLADRDGAACLVGICGTQFTAPIGTRLSSP